MNEFPEGIGQLDLDRLVEGELDDQQRRKLIEQLESENGGWRRCALAFLESQAWRREIRSLVADSGGQQAIETAGRHRPTNRRRGRRIGALSAAAAVLVAFTVGLGCGTVWRSHGQPIASDPQPTPNRTTGADDQPPSIVDETPTPADDRQKGSDDGMRLVGLVEFGGDSQRRRTMPVVAVPDEHSSDAWTRTSPLSDYDRQQLARRGWRVIDERRHHVSVANLDGSRVTIPYYRIRCQYIGDQIY